MAELVDKELELDDAQNRGEVVKMLQVALLCMQNEAHDRPTMEEVAKMLSGKGLAEKWQKWQVSLPPLHLPSLRPCCHLCSSSWSLWQAQRRPLGSLLIASGVLKLQGLKVFLLPACTASQAEAGNIKAEDLLQIVNTPGIWNNLSTGVSLEGFGVQGPR